LKIEDSLSNVAEAAEKHFIFWDGKLRIVITKVLVMKKNGRKIKKNKDYLFRMKCMDENARKDL